MESSSKGAARSLPILGALTRHVYNQTIVAMAASSFCALVIAAGVYTPQHNKWLYIWLSIFFVMTILRIFLVLLFKHSKHVERKIHFWQDLYIIGAILGGASWGLAGIILFPHITAEQQTLMIIMFAGVTAGSVSLSAAIPKAAIGFLCFSLTPFIISLILTGSRVYLIFDFALTLYLVYLIILVMKSYHLIRNSLELQFQNSELLKSVSDAKIDLENINKKLEFSATHDSLTQIPNRRLFLINLDEAIKRAQATKTIVALLYIDFDQFKLVNDAYGHEVGDKLILLVVERLLIFINKGNNLARLGGDELTIVLEDLKEEEEVEGFAKQVCQLISLPFTINNMLLKITASIGISIYPNDGITPEALLQHADKALYYVKEHGGNNYRFNALEEA